MTAEKGHPKLRARIADALADYLLDTRPKHVAEIIGRHDTTVARRDPELNQWPTDELLALALENEALAKAMIMYLVGEAADGSAPQLIPSLFEGIGQLAETIRSANAALSDGKVSDDEREELINQLGTLATTVNQIIKNIYASKGE